MTSNAETVITANKALINGALMEAVTLSLTGGRIQSIDACKNESGSGHSPSQAQILLPGMIDIQVNGGGDCLFNQQPNIEALKTIDAAHLRFGTTRWLPTVITDHFSVMQQAADAVAELIRQQQSGIQNTGVLGIHFEGPHLSEAKKGVHPAHHIRELSDQEMQLYLRQDLGQVLLTIAPENVSLQQIQKLTEAGVIVCLGHSNATYEQTREALAAGATGFTHLYNAMSAMTSREPGMVGAALSSSAYYGLILDGIHVHPAAAKAAFRANPNLILVTDAMALVGGQKNSFRYLGQDIVAQKGSLRDEQGRLAGSAISMQDALFNARQWLTDDWQTLASIASQNAANFLRQSHCLGNLKSGAIADCLLLDENKNRIDKVWRAGQLMFSRKQAS